MKIYRYYGVRVRICRLSISFRTYQNSFKVSGFDTKYKRIKELNQGIDSTNEITKKSDFSCANITFTSNYLNVKNLMYLLLQCQLL